MDVSRLTLENVGQIKRADVTFGDLTVLVGPQATGKSIFLQWLRLMVEPGYVHSEMRKHGLDWKRTVPEFLNVYLGEGMAGLWAPSRASSVSVNGTKEDCEAYVTPRNRGNASLLFYVPAQRVLTIANGWPLPFSGYGAGDPFAVRDFSERSRLMMEKEFRRGANLFPRRNTLKQEYRELLARHVFGGFSLRLDTHGAQKRLVLREKVDSEDIPVMAWSAGQREFVPLLLGMYWLMPPAKVSLRDALKWVIIEEPEMGLHPDAISVVMLLALELMARGYRVCVSTHSPHVLDVVWALRMIREHEAPAETILDIFKVRHTPTTKDVATGVYCRNARVYYFDHKGHTREISSLDPGSDDVKESGWGGLTEFSGIVGEVVSRVVNAKG